jgi:hypothetical protein
MAYGIPFSRSTSMQILAQANIQDFGYALSMYLPMVSPMLFKHCPPIMKRKVRKTNPYGNYNKNINFGIEV